MKIIEAWDDNPLSAAGTPSLPCGELEHMFVNGRRIKIKVESTEEYPQETVHITDGIEEYSITGTYNEFLDALRNVYTNPKLAKYFHDRFGVSLKDIATQAIRMTRKAVAKANGG